MTARLIAAGAGALARAWVESAADPERPLAPRYLVAPNILILADLRRRAARAAGAWANLRTHTIEQLADLLAEPELSAAGKTPLDPLARRVLIASLVRTARFDYLAPLADQDGLVLTLDALFADLEEAGFSRFPPEATTCVTPPEKARDLAAIYDAFRARVRPARYTTLDVYDAATRAASGAADRLGTRSIALFGFSDFNRAQRRLVAALAESVELDVYLPWRDTPAYRFAEGLRRFVVDELGGETVDVEDETADPPTDRERLARRFFCDPDESDGPAAGDGTVRVLSAPDEVREAREVVREVLVAARQGVPLSEIAVVYGGEDERALLVEELARAADDVDRPIPLHVDGGRPARSRPEGLFAERVWDAALSRWRRPEIIQLLRLSGSADAQPGAAWDALTRRLPIVEGWRRWEARLADAAGDLRIPAVDREALAALRRVLDPLLTFRRAVDEGADAAAVCACARRVAGEMLPDGEVRDAFLDRHDALVADAEVAGCLAARDVPGIMRAIAEGLTLGSAHFRDGAVTLVPVQRVRHLAFRRVIVCGMTEQRIPSAGRQDPLLLDDERRAINRRAGEQRLPIKGDRAAEQVYLFAQAIASARESLTLTYPRTERVGGRRLVASHFLTRVAEALPDAPGRPPLVRRIAAGAPVGGSERWVSRREMIAKRVAAEPDPSAAWSLALGASAAARPSLVRRAYRLRALGAESDLTAHDGRLSAESAERIARVLNPLDGPVSPTRLETYAACPRCFWLTYILGFEPLKEPGERVRLDPLSAGELVHRVLQDGFEQAASRGLFPAREETRTELVETLREALDRHAARLDAEGLLPEPAFWAIDREQVRADLARLVREEIADGGRYEPLAFEVRFGREKTGDAPESALSTESPAVVSAGSRTLSFAGRIDRIDAGLEGVRVLDYKTGLAPRKRDTDVLKGGEMLQLPVYIEATSAIVPERGKQGVAAFYYYATSRGGFARWGIERGAYDALRPAVLSVLDSIAGGIEAGLFFPNPFGKKHPDHCAYCPHAAYCGPLRGLQRLAERKSADADRDRYQTMKETG